MLTLDLDSKKLVGYEGGRFHVGSIWTHGEKAFSDNYVGDLNKVNLIDFPNAWRLWELWYEQKFCDDRVSLKIGQMAVDQDFLMAEFYNSLASINLLNQTFFYPTLAFNVYNIPGFPGPLHALQLKTQLGLSDSQRATTEALYAEMRNKALPIGRKIIEAERTLDQAFAVPLAGPRKGVFRGGDGGAERALSFMLSWLVTAAASE